MGACEWRAASQPNHVAHRRATPELRAGREGGIRASEELGRETGGLPSSGREFIPFKLENLIRSNPRIRHRELGVHPVCVKHMITRTCPGTALLKLTGSASMLTASALTNSRVCIRFLRARDRKKGNPAGQVRLGEFRAAAQMGRPPGPPGECSCKSMMLAESRCMTCGGKAALKMTPYCAFPLIGARLLSEPFLACHAHRAPARRDVPAAWQNKCTVYEW